MLAVEKYVDYEAWESRRRGHKHSRTTSTITADAPDEALFELEIEANRSLGRESFGVILKGKIPPRPWQGFARYDIQDEEHQNPSWHSPTIIEPGLPHRHLYNERAARENRWDWCADPISITKPLWEPLLSQFLIDLNIHFSESHTHTSLFEWIKE